MNGSLPPNFVSGIPCPKCGRATDPSWAQCPNCGAALPSVHGTPVPSPELARAEAAQLQLKGSKATLVLIWVLAGVFLAAGIVISNFGQHPNYPSAGFTVGGIILLVVGILTSFLYARKYATHA
jgi:hypothetical protein